jgi:hypothetical protein
MPPIIIPLFPAQDTEITVKDLWDVWWKSEVHNWTVDQTVEWLVKSVGLPQYEQAFRDHRVVGARMPQVNLTIYLFMFNDATDCERMWDM